jgi:protein-S-isoprenylcysteine O-methyltransferase Ste14
VSKQDDDKYYLMAPLNAHVGEALDYANRADHASASARSDDVTDRRTTGLSFKTFIITLAAPGLIAGVLPIILLAATSAPPVEYVLALRFLGMIPIALGASIYAWCAWNFARDRRSTPASNQLPHNFMQHGLYQYSRNPMYLGVGLALIGESVLFESVVLLVYTAIMLIVFRLRVVYVVEPTLRQKYGEAYTQYCQRVPRWFRVSWRTIQRQA